MAVNCNSRNKWQSQQVHKIYKNKHRDEFDDAHWSSVSYGNYCNQYLKDLYTYGHPKYHPHDSIYYDEYDEYKPQYWTCNQCTFNNIERDLYCSICDSPFISTTKPSKYASDFMTFGDHLPSAINDIIHIEDDMDESIQFAIIYSYNCVPQNHQQTDTEIYTNHTKTRHKTYEQLTRERIRREKLHRTKEQRRVKQDKRRKEGEKARKERNTIAKCTQECPKISTVVGHATIKYIQSELHQYYGRNKSYDIELILNYSILLQFLSNNKVPNEWEFVYHGTDSKNNTSIISKGLIAGGSKGVAVSHGAAYGRGVYCSPYTGTASSYEKGSMFICIARKRRIKAHGRIWVVPCEKDILPLYLVSFGNNKLKSGPLEFPYFPISAALQSILSPAAVAPVDNGLTQQLVRFIPSFKTLNCRNTLNRKIKRKWSAYYKINQYAQR